MAEKDAYLYLTDKEQAYWDIYTRLRALSDWPGFTNEQRRTKELAKAWLGKTRDAIEQTAIKENDWTTNHRRDRINFLLDADLNRGVARRVSQLPTAGMTPDEKVLVSEREMWWGIASVDDETHAWRLSNANALTTRRRQIFTLAEQDGWDKNERRLRWQELCVATKTGEAFDEWKKTHDVGTGEAKKTPKTLSSRHKAVRNARTFIGVTEHPANTNKGEPQPSTWQRRVIGADGFPWCACFTTCMAWDAGAKGGSSAGVIVCMDMAQKGLGIFKGWTTDPSKVRAGDFAVISCKTCHIGLVVDDHDAFHTIEGNTSPTSVGSQFNGGCVAEKHRPHNQIIGWCLVDYS